MKKAFSSLLSLVLALGIGFLAVLAPPIGPTDMASAEDADPRVCLESLGPGQRLVLTGGPVFRTWAGLFHMSVDGARYDGWCIELENDIAVDECFDATLSDAPREMPWCEIGHILTNYSATSDTEGAALQLAFWKYFYPGLAARYPTEVEMRALAIRSEAAGRSVIGPDSALSLTPDDGVVVNGGGTASQKFIAKITDPGCLAGIPIDFSLNFTTGTGSFSPDSALTDSAGEASVTVSWDASQSSYEFTITAHTEGEWPVIIEPQELNRRGEPIQKAIISEPYELTAAEHRAQEQEEELGSLEVTKIVDWDDVTPDTGKTFEICITGPSYPAGDCKTADYNGEVLTWDNLIPGDYTVTETDPGTEWTVVVTGSPATVVTGGTASAEVTNTYGAGSLEVTKTVNWSGYPEDTTKTFEICITGPSYPSGDCKTADYNGEVLTWDNLIPGDYTVTETGPGTEWTVVVTGSPATVVSTGTAYAGVTNTYVPGSLEVTKTVNWSGYPEDTTKTFEICITGPSYPSGDCKTADYNGEVLTWDNLIPGDYTVTETDPGIEWDVVVTGSPATVVSTGTAYAGVTNTYKLGSLEVTKTVNWSGYPEDTTKTFEICITGPSYPSGDCKTADYNGEVLTWDNLIPGDYTVTETDPGTEWTVVVTGSPATVVSTGTAYAGVTNTYECVARIEGYKFANQCCSNGTWDPWEPPVADWEIYLIDYANYILGDYTSKITTTTDATGLFYFDDVTPGLYVVFEEHRSGWTACTVENLSRCWPLRDWYVVVVTNADCGQTITVDVYGQNLLFGNKPDDWPPPQSFSAMSPQGSELLGAPVCRDEV